MLLDSLDVVAGFARLSASAKDPRGSSWALFTALLLEPRWRHCGVGHEFLGLLEKEAARLGFRYTSVWTDEATLGFYAKAGYLKCEPQSIARPVLSDKPVALLERLLLSRSTKEGDTCLRKRLVERGPVLASRRDDLLSEVLGELALLAGDSSLSRWTALSTIDVPWERQVGPSCGLAALRMVASSSLVDARLEVLDELLEHAKKLGASTDGEIFEINDLATLASHALGMTAVVEPFVPQAVTPASIYILTYDKGPGAGRPERRSGFSAHYGIVMGSALLDASRLALIIQHGASKKLVAAFADDWQASNAQLTVRSNEGPIHLAGLCVKISSRE